MRQKQIWEGAPAQIAMEGALFAITNMVLTASGPASWRRVGSGATRVSAWSARLGSDAMGEAVAVLNEEVARGRRLTV